MRSCRRPCHTDHLRDRAALRAKDELGQNLLAAKGCTVYWKGRDLSATDPKLVGSDVALEAAGNLQCAVISRFGFPAFIQLQR